MRILRVVRWADCESHRTRRLFLCWGLNGAKQWASAQQWALISTEMSRGRTSIVDYLITEQDDGWISNSRFPIPHPPPFRCIATEEAMSELYS